MTIQSAINISVITITRNACRELAATIESVACQSYQHLEYIVIDGASTDGTVDLIQERESQIDYWVSEPDEGIAHAFNKGIAAASGDYLLFLNSGDTLLDSETLASTVEKDLGGHPQCLVGRVVLRDVVRGNDHVIGRPVSPRQQLLRNYFPHQGMFIRKDTFEQIGAYDTNFKLGMDYEWSLRLLEHFPQESIAFTSRVIAVMPAGGASMANFVQTFRMYDAARRKHNLLPQSVSYMISAIFIGRRWLGTWLRKLVQTAPREAR